MKYDEHAQAATLQLIRDFDRHKVDHVLADNIDEAGCVFCSMEESISKLKNPMHRTVMWDHYLGFTGALQK